MSTTQSNNQINIQLLYQPSSDKNTLDFITLSRLDFPRNFSVKVASSVITVIKKMEDKFVSLADTQNCLLSNFMVAEYNDQTKMESVKINVVDVIGSEFCVSTEDARKLYDNVSHCITEKRKVVLSFKNVRFLTPLFLNMSICQLYGQFEEDIINDYVSIVDIDENNKRMLSIQKKRANHYFKNPELFNKIANTSFGEYNE
ncbi:hypothetical protein SDC9_106251 [bioreactor metagenome]|uniref:DUF4325 domain-containing protein n=1 Tax=bioreactor metagenome TaxID=1076179 RepID=A0A645B1X4_9ZZZZ